jgi:hypothetical protein
MAFSVTITQDLSAIFMIMMFSPPDLVYCYNLSLFRAMEAKWQQRSKSRKNKSKSKKGAQNRKVRKPAIASKISPATPDAEYIRTPRALPCIATMPVKTIHVRSLSLLLLFPSVPSFQT